MLDLDVRAVAAGRIALALLVLHDVYGRVTDTVHWGVGVGPYIVAPSDTPHKAWIHTVLFHRGSVAFEACWMAAIALVASSLLAGWRSRASAALTWALVVCMQARNQHNHDGSDKYLRHFLLWSSFLPIGDVMSVDALARVQGLASPGSKADGGKVREAVRTPATAGLILQLFIVYLSVVVKRTGKEWWPPQLSAVYYVVSIPFGSNSLGHALSQYPAMCQLLTAGSMVAETIAPTIILLTSSKSVWRLLACASIAALHLGIGSHVNLVNWPLTASCTLVFFLPAPVFSTLSRVARARLFPQRCLLTLPCPAQLEHEGTLSLLPALCKGLLAALGCSVVIRPADGPSLTVYGKAGPTHCTNANAILAPLLDAVATPTASILRRVVGAAYACLLRGLRAAEPSPAVASSAPGRRLRNLLSLLLCVYMVQSSLGDVFPNTFSKVDSGDIGEAIRFDQDWVMFTPSPPSSGNWVIVAGTPADGVGWVDALAGLKVGNWSLADSRALVTPPAVITTQYRSFRWDKFFDKASSDQDRMRVFAGYVCEVAPIALHSVAVYRVPVTVAPPASVPQYHYAFPKSEAEKEEVEGLEDLKPFASWTCGNKRSAL